MKLESKIERIKTELRFLIEGDGSTQDKREALDELGAYAEQCMIDTAKAAEAAESMTITPGDVGSVTSVLGDIK